MYGLSIETLLLRSAFSVRQLRKYCTTNSSNDNKRRRPLAVLRSIFRKEKDKNEEQVGKVKETAAKVDTSAAFFAEDGNLEFTHRVEVTAFHGYNFPSVYTAGKPQCYLVASLSGGIDSIQRTEVAIGDNPRWNDKLCFDVPCGYLHRTLNLTLFYKPKLFGSDKEMGSVSHPLLSVDECKEEQDLSTLSMIKVAIEPNLNVKNLEKKCSQIKEEQREPLALELVMKVLRISD